MQQEDLEGGKVKATPKYSLRAISNIPIPDFVPDDINPWELSQHLRSPRQLPVYSDRPGHRQMVVGYICHPDDAGALRLHYDVSGIPYSFKKWERAKAKAQRKTKRRGNKK